MELDLHGVKHQDVGSLLDSFIWENMKRKTSYIKIITGNSSKMKEIVYEIVEEYGFTISDDYGITNYIIINLV